MHENSSLKGLNHADFLLMKRYVSFSLHFSRFYFKSWTFNIKERNGYLKIVMKCIVCIYSKKVATFQRCSIIILKSSFLSDIVESKRLDLI